MMNDDQQPKVIWATPPNARDRLTSYLDELRSRPGEWGQYPTPISGQAVHKHRRRYTEYYLVHRTVDGVGYMFGYYKKGGE